MQLDLYPITPGYQLSDTSIEAAESMRETYLVLQKKCLDLLQNQNLTPDETAKMLGVDKLAIRPRFSELKERGLIEDSGERRKNQSGRNAIVWTVRET